MATVGIKELKFLLVQDTVPRTLQMCSIM